MNKIAIVALVMAASLPLMSACRAQDKPDMQAQNTPAGSVWLDSLDISRTAQDYGLPRGGKSVDSNPLTLDGKAYPHGLGTHAASQLVVDLKGAATRFEAIAGVDDERKGQGSVVFEVYVDGVKKAETKTLHGGDAPVPVSVDLTGAKRLLLNVTDAGDGNTDDHADWAGALLTLVPGAAAMPVTVPVPEVTGPTLPIFMGADSPKPAIHGPRIVGATPSRPFLFRIPATGTAPLTFSATSLPAGLTLNTQTGVISGSLESAGTTRVKLTVSGPKGKSSRTLTVVGGPNKLALTPPMGWNSWNVWAGTVDDQKVRDAADQLISAGLAAHGYAYINIDDCWQGNRDARGNI